MAQGSDHATDSHWHLPGRIRTYATRMRSAVLRRRRVSGLCAPRTHRVRRPLPPALPNMPLEATLALRCELISPHCLRVSHSSSGTSQARADQNQRNVPIASGGKGEPGLRP